MQLRADAANVAEHPAPPPPNDGGTPNTPGSCETRRDDALQGRAGRNVPGHVDVTGANPTTKTVGSIADGQCVDVASVDPASKDDVIVAIVENAVLSRALDHIRYSARRRSGAKVTKTASMSFEGSHGAVVTYFNNAAVTLCKQGVGRQLPVPGQRRRQVPPAVARGRRVRDDRVDSAGGQGR